MKRLRTIEGSGRLLAGSSDLGAVRYRIEVYARGGFAPKIARGGLTADLSMAEAGLITGRECTLRLEDGAEIDISVTQVTDGQASFNVSGPLPGF